MLLSKQHESIEKGTRVILCHSVVKQWSQIGRQACKRRKEVDWAIFHTEDALQLLAPRTPEIRYYMASQPVTKLCKGGRKLFQFQLMWIRRNADINLTVGTIFGERSIACYLCTFFL